MALIDADTEEALQIEFQNIDDSMRIQDKDLKKRKYISWVLSAVIHTTIILFMSIIVFVGASKDFENPPLKISILPYIEKVDNVKLQHVNINAENVIIDTTEDVTDTATIITEIVTTSEEPSSDDNQIVAATKGREDAVSASELGGQGAFMAIGAGGGGGGLFGQRSLGGNKRDVIASFGPHSRGIPVGIDNGLKWLKRHQSPDGSWSSANYFKNCGEIPKCEPGKDVEGGDDAMTGYALLCFLGAGYDHVTPSKYKGVVSKGLKWLLSKQTNNGLIGNRNYEHAICSMALIEAYGMTLDQAFRQPSQKAVDIIISRQTKINKDYAVGWDYIDQNPTRQDLSVSGWNIMALKSAVGAGLNTKNSMRDATHLIEMSWKAANPNWGKKTDPYTDTTIFPYVWNTVTNVTEGDHLSFVGGCALVFLGKTSGDIMLETLANENDKRWLQTGAWKNNMYCLYYSSLFSIQTGGKHWLAWRDAYAPYLIQGQLTENDGVCKSGTWKFEPQNFAGGDTSQILLHCYALLSLEVATRYSMVHVEDNVKKK